MRAVVVCLVIALACTIARADDALVAAKRLEANLEYEKALVLIDREIARGAADRPRLVELHVMAGKLAAGIDHPDTAATHFAIALALAPATTLPDGTSPKLAEPFEAARAIATPLAIVLRREADRVTATVGADPAAIFASLRIYLSGDGTRTASGGTIAIAGATTTVTAADALDRFGNVLVHTEFPTKEVEYLILPRVTEPSIVGRWTTWAIVGGGTLVVAGLCAWRFGVAQDDWNTLDREGGHDFSELRSVEDRGRHWGLAANIGFGATAAAGVTAVVLYLFNRTSAPVSITATSETVGVAARF